MVVGAFPAAKLGVLLIKHISKPIANVIKSKAKQSQFFRQYICMPPAQFYNWCEVQAKMWSMNLGKPVNVPQLNEAMAIELGANLLGEVIIFTIGAGVLIFEYVRQSKKETIKEENTHNEKLQLELKLNELSFHIERQDTQIRELSRMVAELASRSWLPKKPKIINDAIKMGEQAMTGQLSPKNITYQGNFNPNDGIMFKALNLIENEVFSSDDDDDDCENVTDATNVHSFYSGKYGDRRMGIVTKALIYLDNYEVNYRVC